MKDNFTSISVVLDRSGSMAPLLNDTLGSFNKFLNDQKAVAGDAIFTLALFDDKYNLVHDCKSISEVPELNKDTYTIGGSTALLDAIGKTINETGAKLAAMKEEDRPSKVILVVITDGEENCSREFGGETGRAKIMQMMEHQQTKYNWDCIFLGAQASAIQAGTSMGFAATSSYKYASTSGGTKRLFDSLSAGISNSRRGLTKSATIDRDTLDGDNEDDSN
jgi:Mg-chelatase subunit ChlD